MACSSFDLYRIDSYNISRKNTALRLYTFGSSKCSNAIEADKSASFELLEKKFLKIGGKVMKLFKNGCGGPLMT